MYNLSHDNVNGYWLIMHLNGVCADEGSTVSDTDLSSTMLKVRPAYVQASTQQEIEANVASIRSRIAAACERSGRAVSEVRLLPVSKTVDTARLRLAYAAGCRELGENKVQEAFSKSCDMADLTDLHWSVIGHLQTNKARVVAKFAHEFQALDSLRLAQELDRRLQAEGRVLNVLVQVNTSAEPSKYGLAPESVEKFMRELPAFSSLRVQGFMTLALFSDDQVRVRECFVRLRELRDRLRQTVAPSISLDQLSMGMSGDFEAAIEEGATIVRIGQAIFGARALPDAHYWPGIAAD